MPATIPKMHTHIHRHHVCLCQSGRAVACVNCHSSVAERLWCFGCKNSVCWTEETCGERCQNVTKLHKQGLVPSQLASLGGQRGRRPVVQQTHTHTHFIWTVCLSTEHRNNFKKLQNILFGTLWSYKYICAICVLGYCSAHYKPYYPCIHSREAFSWVNCQTAWRMSKSKHMFKVKL